MRRIQEKVMYRGYDEGSRSNYPPTRTLYISYYERATTREKPPGTFVPGVCSLYPACSAHERMLLSGEFESGVFRLIVEWMRIEFASANRGGAFPLDRAANTFLD